MHSLTFFSTFVALISASICGVYAQEANTAHDKWCVHIATATGVFPPSTRLANYAGWSENKPVKVEPVAVTVNSGETVSEKLVEYGFRPDKVNVALAQSLNPQINDINKVSSGERVYIPSLEVYETNKWVNFKPQIMIDGVAVSQKYAKKVANDIEAERDATALEAEKFVADKRLEISPELKETLEEIIKDIKDVSVLDDKNNVDAKELGEFSAKVRKIEVGKLLLNNAVRGNIEAASYTASGAGSNGYNIQVKIKTEDKSGNHLDKLVVRYMSEGAYGYRCDLRYGGRFSTRSYEASHVMPRSRWYFWAEDEVAGKTSVPQLRDLNNVDGAQFEDRLIINWN